MAASEDQVGSCAREHPPRSWTMLGGRVCWASLIHEVHLKHRTLQLLTSGLSTWPGEGSHAQAGRLLFGTPVFTGVSSVP